MYDEQMDRIECYLRKIETSLDSLRNEIGKIGTAVEVEKELMKLTRTDVDRLYMRTDANKTEITVLKTKAGFFGTLGGMIAGTVIGAVMDFFRRA